jgi:very-short-patch-repair endonuclease
MGCLQEFVVKPKQHGKYCSKECQINHNLKPKKYKQINDKQCVHCFDIFVPKSGRQDYCSPDCKKLHLTKPKVDRVLNCLHCDTNFMAKGPIQKFCSATCRTNHNIPAKEEKHCIECNKDITHMNASAKFCSRECWSTNRTKSKNVGIDGVDFITCPICKLPCKEITHNHAKMHGFNSIKDMKHQLGMSETVSQQKKDKLRGENNPGYQHDGKYSAWSKNFINGYDEEKHLANNKHTSDWRKAHPEYNFFAIEYWLKETNGDEALAKKLYSKSQTRDLSWFVEKFGEEDGKIRHKAKTEKWTKSFKKTNFSMISQELFVEISKYIDTDAVYYATNNRVDMDKYKNKEYILEVVNTWVRPDFVCLKSKKVIEFDGTYWHSPAKANPERERRRDESIKSAGYQVLHIAEHDYRQNKQKVIEKCISFLNQ